MKNIAPILLSVLLFMPIVEAQSLGQTTIQPLRVLDTQTHTVNSNDVNGASYQFVFPVPPWNMTPSNHTQPNDLAAFELLVTNFEPSQSDHTVEYNITFNYNNTHSFAVDKLFTRTPATLFGVPIFGRYFWVRDTSFYVDGAQQCHDTYHDFSIYGWSSTYETRGSARFYYNRQANLTAFSTGSPQQFFANDTGIGMDEGVNTAYALQCFEGGILSGGGGAFSVKAGTAWNVTDLQSPILVYVNVSDTRLYSNSLTYAANSEAGLENLIAQTLSTTTPANCSGFFNFISNCINPLNFIGAMLSWSSNLITSLLSHFGAVGNTLANAVTYPLQIMIDILDFISIIFINTTSPHGVTGGFWMLLLWLSSMGFLIDGIFGFKGYFLTIPGIFAYGAFLAIIYGAYFMFWIVPRAAVDIASRILTAITNLIP